MATGSGGDLVAPALLGAVEGLISLFDQGKGFALLVGHHGRHAETQGDVVRHLGIGMGQRQIADGLQQALGLGCTIM